MSGGPFDLDPVFLKGLGYLHSKSKDSAQKLKALLDEYIAKGNDAANQSSQKDVEVRKAPGSKVPLTKQDSKSSSSSSSSSGNTKSSGSKKIKRDVDKKPVEKSKVTDSLDVGDPPKKARIEKPLENRSSPITVPANKDLMPDLSSLDETSADIFAMEMGLACVVCSQMTVTSGNQLVECQECHNLYHQDCHKPHVTDKDVNDPRLVWYCARCTRQMKSMAQKSQKPQQKASPAVASSSVKKPETKPKLQTTNNFQAFKRTEVNASAAVSSNNSSSGSLTGWAAFTKTSAGGPSTTKLSSSSQGGSGKSTHPTSATKPTGLPGMASAKSGLGTKVSSSPTGNSNGNNGSGSAPLKPPPPLTVGKQMLSSGDSLGKGTAAGPSSSSSSSSSSSGSLGGNIKREWERQWKRK